MPWTFHVLGTLRLQHGGEDCLPVRKKAQALLLFLALKGRPHSRDSLAGWFWPDLDERRGRTSLRSALSDLNRVLGRDWLLQSGDALALHPDFPIDVDAAALSQASRRKAVLSPEQLKAWDGELAEGFALSECDAFDEWLYFQRESLRQQFLALLELKVADAAASCDWPVVFEMAGLWLSRDPLSENAHWALMQAHAANGRLGQARDQYRKLEKLLDQELGVRPAMAIETYYKGLKLNRASRTVSLNASPQAHKPDIGEVAYARNGNVHLAYREAGSAKHTLIYLWGFVSHLEQGTEEPWLANYLGELARRFRLILFDKRGMGLSDRTGRPPSLEDTAGDVIALMDHLGVERATLIGQSEGGPAAITCAHHYPERVQGLILIGTAAKWTRSRDYPHALPPELYDKWLDQLESNWGHAANLQQFAPSCAGNEQVIKWWAKTLRLASSPGSIRDVLKVAKDIDVRHLLSSIQQPTLVVQREGDRLIRAANGRYLASNIANAEYLELPGSDHWIWVQPPEEFFKALDGFKQDLDS